MRRDGSGDTRGPGYRYLRAKGNSIEGGTSEIMRNIIAERVLRLPPEPRTDTERPVEGPARADGFRRRNP